MNFTRRQFCSLTAAGVMGLPVLQTTSCRDNGSRLPKPSPQQLAWQDLELGLFIHFGMRTFTGTTWLPELADPNVYQPDKLDTDQWLEAARAMGAKYAVYVASHGTGFLSWQSDAYPYGVKQTSWRNGKGDVVRDFIASCEKYNIKPGLYATVATNAYWNVKAGLVNRGKGGDPEKQAAYAKACEVMLTELWSNYGELTEIWFDGGALPPEKGGPDMIPILKEHQPNAIVFQGPAASIRWVGNEKGIAPYPCWATVKKGLKDPYGLGDPNGSRWLPAECDLPLPGHRWFWNQEQNKEIEPLDTLIKVYYNSVGRNCNMLLNSTPDTSGLIPEANMRHYVEFGNEIRKRFNKPVAETQGKGDLVELSFKQPSIIDHVIIMEDIAHGERVRAYEVEGLVPGNTWQKLCDGLSIGHKRIQRFKSTEVAKVRFRNIESIASPKIRRLAVYNVG